MSLALKINDVFEEGSFIRDFMIFAFSLNTNCQIEESAEFIVDVLPKKIRFVWLLVASYIFYGAWNVKYLALLFGITFITYMCAILIDKIAENTWEEKKKKLGKKVVLSLLQIIFY